MKAPKILIAFILSVAVLLAQVGAVFAAPGYGTTSLSGTVQTLTLETDTNTTITTVLVTILDKHKSQTVRLSLDTAEALGLIITDVSGMPVINPDALGITLQIDPETVISDEEANRHPVGDALATFFGDITDYETIMAAHNDGAGFGVIVQALWLTQKLKGNSETFLAILLAKQTGNYSAFTLEDGTTPKNWGEFRKAILDGEKKGTLGIIMSHKDKDNGNNHDNGNKDKNKDKGNNENGNKDKNRDKEK
ncbi:MAG: hypothetical protein ABI904_18745 [Chloroflexota bacterium]